MEERLLTHVIRFSIIVTIGLAICVVTRTKPRVRWLAVSLVMIVAHDYFLTNGYGHIPPILQGLNWNWTGKLMALGVGLIFVFLIGRKRCGLTLQHNSGSGIAVLVCAVLTGVAIVSALIWGGGPGSPESIAFRLTMPGLEEEVFYRGALLASLSLAFPIRWTVFGVETTPAFFLNSLIFGMVHGVWISSSGLGFTTGAVVFSTVSGLVFTWLRERTGSLLLPMYMHNAWNTAYAIF